MPNTVLSRHNKPIITTHLLHYIIDYTVNWYQQRRSLTNANTSRVFLFFFIHSLCLTLIDLLKTLETKLLAASLICSIYSAKILGHRLGSLSANCTEPNTFCPASLTVSVSTAFLGCKNRGRIVVRNVQD